MTNLTFAQLCAEFAAAEEQIGRLSGLMPSFRSDEHPYQLEEQKKRREASRAEIKRRIEGENA